MHHLLIGIAILVALIGGYLLWQNQTGSTEYSPETVNAELEAAMPGDLSDDFKDVDAEISTL
jgi:hypothetical protein